MNSREFCYWLQGYFELRYLHSMSIGDKLTQYQYKTILDHLSIVKIPDIGFVNQFDNFCLYLRERLKNWEDIDTFEIPMKLSECFNNEPVYTYDYSTFPPGQYESLIKYVSYASC